MNQNLFKGIRLFALVRTLEHHAHLNILHDPVLRVEDIYLVAYSAFKPVWVGLAAHKEVIHKTLIPCKSDIAFSAREGQALRTLHHVFLDDHAQLALKLLWKMIDCLRTVEVLYGELWDRLVISCLNVRGFLFKLLVLL